MFPFSQLPCACGKLSINLQAEPPAIIVATVASLCQMVERRAFSLQSMRVLVIDEVRLSLHFLSLESNYCQSLLCTLMLCNHICKGG